MGEAGCIQGCTPGVWVSGAVGRHYFYLSCWYFLGHHCSPLPPFLQAPCVPVCLQVPFHKACPNPKGLIVT